MKATTPERERIYGFFLNQLGMKAKDIAHTFETSESTLRRLKSGKLEACYRIAKTIIKTQQNENTK